jgi:hypothetical protein
LRRDGKAGLEPSTNSVGGICKKSQSRFLLGRTWTIHQLRWWYLQEIAKPIPVRPDLNHPPTPLVVLQEIAKPIAGRLDLNYPPTPLVVLKKSSPKVLKLMIHFGTGTNAGAPWFLIRIQKNEDTLVMNFATRGSHDSTAVRVGDNLRGKETFECREISILGSSDEGIEKSFSLLVTYGRLTLIWNMFSGAGDDLPRVLLSQTKDLRDFRYG